MCGLAGELSAAGPPDVEAVERMAATLTARGPDGAGSWSGGRCALGHRRLTIIDLSERGAQPMEDAAVGVTGVFNGCIYNHRELRVELEGRGHMFRSTSDTEVILKAYAEWGTACVERFRGMFAFALHERDTDRLVLARDRLGVKPLYLADVGGALRFASTLPALLAGGGIDTSIDPVALHHYLTWHAVVPAPHTILAGVRKLPPATVLTVEPDGARHEERYWEPRFERRPEDAGMEAEDWNDAVLEAVRSAVEWRMVSDVPVGVLLSGGLDSSLIVGLLAEAGQRGLATFSIGFDDAGGREGNEFRYSDLIAEQFETDHHQLRVGGAELLAALPAAIAAMSEPMVSHDAVAFYLLSQEVVKTRKVVQCGQGADEVFAGYSWYQPLDGIGGPGDPVYAREFFDRPNEELDEVLEPGVRAEPDPSRALVAREFARPGAEEAVDRALRLDTEIMLVDDPVKRVDNMTMAWGLEARTPFLDHDLVELAAACPPSLKLAGGGKGVLKEASRGVVPGAVIDRPKGYFPVPALSHLDGGALAAVTEALRSQAARDRGVFRREYVEKLLAAPNEHRTTLEGSKLWQLGLLELWLQAHGV